MYQTWNHVGGAGHPTEGKRMPESCGIGHGSGNWGRENPEMGISSMVFRFANTAIREVTKGQSGVFLALQGPEEKLAPGMERGSHCRA